VPLNTECPELTLVADPELVVEPLVEAPEVTEPLVADPEIEPLVTVPEPFVAEPVPLDTELLEDPTELLEIDPLVTGPPEELKPLVADPPDTVALEPLPLVGEPEVELDTPVALDTDPNTELVVDPELEPPGPLVADSDPLVTDPVLDTELGDAGFETEGDGVSLLEGDIEFDDT
jgi:hypothetical protein